MLLVTVRGFEGYFDSFQGILSNYLHFLHSLLLFSGFTIHIEKIVKCTCSQANSNFVEILEVVFASVNLCWCFWNVDQSSNRHSPHVANGRLNVANGFDSKYFKIGGFGSKLA